MPQTAKDLGLSDSQIAGIGGPGFNTTPTGLSVLPPQNPAPAPTITPPAASSTTTTPTAPTSPTAPSTTTPGAGLPDASFLSLLNNLNGGLQQNNKLVDQKSAVVAALLGNQADPAKLATLPPDIQSIIQSGNRDQLLLQAKILDNAISGKNDTVANSIGYLTRGYQQAQQDAETQKQNAINNVIQFAQTYGSGASTALKSLYGDSYVSQLKDMGIDIDAYTKLQTLAEQKQNAAATGSVGDYTFDTAPIATVQTSSGNTPVSQYALVAGDDPYVIAQQNGTDMATLEKLNPTITDWKNLQPGAVINLPNPDAAWLNGKTKAQVDAYNNLPATDKGSIKQLVTGDALLTDIVKSRGATTQGQINKIIAEATAIDPGFSINQNKQRYAYKTQFNNPNGADQTQINAINTGLGHLAELATLAKAVGNKQFQDFNALKNYADAHAGDPDVTNLETVIAALGSELAAIYKGKGNSPSTSEIQDWQDKITKNLSPAQFQGFSNTTSSLVSNKLQSLAESYQNVMGEYPDSPIVNPDVIQSLHDAGVDVSPIVAKLKSQGYIIPDYSESAAAPSSGKNSSGNSYTISQTP